MALFLGLPLSLTKRSLMEKIFTLMFNYIRVTLEKFYPKYHTCVPFFLSQEFSSWQNPILQEENISNHTGTKADMLNAGLKIDELGFVMSNLGMSLSQEEDQFMDCTGREELSALFDQTEPGLDEVKEAFSIFDQNKDGYIDAKELQRVLLGLGLREGTDLEACQLMINQHSRNQDGKIELSEFSKLLEAALF